MKKFEIILKNFLLNLLLLAKFSKKKPENNFDDPSSAVLLIRLNRIGDALVTTPLLRELRKKIKSRIYLLADSKNYFVFKNNPDIDKVIILRKNIRGFLQILRTIKNEKINTVVDLHDDVSTTVSFLIALCSAGNKFGLEKDNKKIYSQTVKRIDARNNHVIKRIMEIGKLFGIETESADPSVHFFPGKEAFADAEKFTQENFSEAKFLIGVNISAGSGARFWGVENYKMLMEYLSGFNVNLLLLSSPGDIDYAKEISANKLPVFSSPKYEVFGAIISKLGMLFTPDTAAVHLASAYNVPVFGLYVKYNTEDMIWSPCGCKFDYILTEEPTLKNIKFKDIQEKLDLFLKSLIC